MFINFRWISVISKLLVCAACFAVFTLCGDAANDPFAKVPQEKREALKKRIDVYVKLQRDHGWSELYDLVSDTGKGGVTREKFVAAMNRGHGRDFANEPDLLEFLPRRAEPGSPDGFDIYGCAKAIREGETYRGIAVIHAVFEHSNWFFTGWTFADPSDGSCKQLDDPSWQPPTQLKWTSPMEELR